MSTHSHTLSRIIYRSYAQSGYSHKPTCVGAHPLCAHGALMYKVNVLQIVRIENNYSRTFTTELR